ncbi:nucleotidyltransferase [Clostridium tetani]|uniref:nucleotidyltransferase n=1 Tax=Clostridium tetani TaxID=1513 RepID=UPI00100B57A8|nr:nucleotidyltransferase [Clostridium tetani]RXI46828.1 nucleotidyltransferase [Clostridium tetani]RXM60732.1 nucleotidyltransferase [Clostridium tetani]RXM68462.1 nucleotidyltransferase [Clostridium tetani]
MNITGVIVEYNPFHNGHLYHLNKTKEITDCDGIVAVMSGHFVQRGSPALLDKWTRAKLALLNGVDLVLELPTIYSTSSAEFFAYGATSLLDGINIVNNLCFGSELGNIDIILKTSKILQEEPSSFKEDLKNFIDKGISFPNAREKALINFMRKEKNSFDFNNVLCLSNNILALEYCKNLFKINSNIKPFTVKRQGSHYNCLHLRDNLSSATAIREYIGNNENLDNLVKSVPETVLNMLKNFQNEQCKFPFEEDMFTYIKHKYFSNTGSIENLPDVSEGIHNRIYRALDTCNTLKEAMNMIKTKRYTYTRIKRILCHYFIGMDMINSDELRRKPCPYARILGFNRKGQDILKLIKKSSNIPIINKIPKKIDSTLNLDINATKCYSLLNKKVNPLDDFLKKPVLK